MAYSAAHPAGVVLACGIEGTSVSAAERDFFLKATPSGVTFFARNVSPDQSRLATLSAELQSLRPSGAPPLLIAIDQEGGRVRRLRAPFPDAGPALRLIGGQHDLAALQAIRAIARDMGGRLRALGINVNWAPVADVLTEPRNVAIGDRAFGRDPEPAARRAGAFLAGLHDAGVLGCLKHFPGQGDAKNDTHLGTAVVAITERQLRERELKAFAPLLGVAPMVMISHCIYPQIDAKPASVSSRVMQGLLRRELGYEGVVVSDDLLMHALPQDNAAWQDAVVAAVAAGADLLLVCRHIERARLAFDALRREAARHPAFALRLEEAARRVVALRHRL